VGGGAGGAAICTVRLVVSHLEGMRSGTRQSLVCSPDGAWWRLQGSPNPGSFAQQLGTAGASVQLVRTRPSRVSQADLERLVRAATGGDYL